MLVRSGVGPAIDPEVLLTLAQGCRRDERVRFGYCDAAGNATERRVEPYGLVNVDRRWYLVARDLDRAYWRTFRLDRMSAPVLTGHRFVRTEEPDTGAMVLERVALSPYAWQAEIVLHTGLQEAMAEIPRTLGSLDAIPDGVVLRIGANELDWIARFLAGLPFDAEVRRPPELRAALRALGRRLQRIHQ
jgi:predicted DNA-binding transcriptional regulator YafY